MVKGNGKLERVSDASWGAVAAPRFLGLGSGAAAPGAGTRASGVELQVPWPWPLLSVRPTDVATSCCTTFLGGEVGQSSLLRSLHSPFYHDHLTGSNRTLF